MQTPWSLLAEVSEWLPSMISMYTIWMKFFLCQPSHDKSTTPPKHYSSKNSNGCTIVKLKMLNESFSQKCSNVSTSSLHISHLPVACPSLVAGMKMMMKEIPTPVFSLCMSVQGFEDTMRAQKLIQMGQPPGILSAFEIGKGLFFDQFRICFWKYLGVHGNNTILLFWKIWDHCSILAEI